MRGGQRGPDQVLVPEGHVEDGATARHEEPFVAVGDEEVWIKSAEV
jgi:hypothetical protein